VEQRGAIARDASGLVDQILGPVVAQHGLDAFKGLPVDECRILVLHDDLPFLERAALVLCPALPSPPRTHLRAAIDKGAGIGRVLEHRRDRRDGGTPPACLAIAVSPRQRKPSLVERADDPNGGTALEKDVEHQSDPGLHLPVRGLGDDTGSIAHQPNRQCQGQLAAFGLGQQARRQAAADRVQLQF